MSDQDKSDQGSNKENKPKVTPLDLLKNPDFISYFKTTKKYREIFIGHDAYYSYIFSLILSILLIIIYKIDVLHLIKFLNDFVGILIGGYFGLLGFIIGAVAIILGLINNQMIDNMQKLDRFDSFVKLCFMFAFTALLNLWVIAELVVLKVVVNMPLSIIPYPENFLGSMFLFICIFLLVHLPSFTIIYATYLVKVSLELLFIKYLVEKTIIAKEKREKEDTK